MRMLNTLGSAGAIVAALAFTPSFAQAANKGSQVDKLLSALQDSAGRTSLDVSRLQSYRNNLRITWDLHLGTWNIVKGDVNAMGALILRLNNLRDGATPLQQKQIDGSLGLIQTMATETNQAIEFLDADRAGSFAYNPAYIREIDTVTAKSGQLARSLGEYLQFAKVRGKELRLEKDLGVSTD